MIALTHDNARDWLNVGSAELNAAERNALTAHLDQCAECQAYAAELSELHTALTRLFRTRWQSMPSQQAKDAAVIRLKQRQTRQRATRRINTLAFAAGLVALALAFVWALNRPAVPAGPQTAAAPAVLSTGQATEAAPTPIPGVATFDQNITLVDAVMEKTRWMAGSTISLTLRWRAPSAVKTSYTSFVHLLDSAGNVVAQSDSIPGITRPTTGQPPDEIGETLYLALPDDLAGRYEVVTGLYDAATGSRLQTADGQTSAALDTIEVQPIPQRINEDFGDFATLLGADGLPASISPGEAISLTLYWRPLATAMASYLVSLQVFDENKGLVAQVDGVPGNGAQPTTTWQPGEIIVDPYTLNLPADLQPGQYRLLLLMFDSASKAQVFTREGNGAVTLATFEVRAKTSAAQPQPMGLPACPVTKPNGNTPPDEAYSAEHHGNGALWTVLWPDGNILMGPHNVEPDGSLSMKFVWWRGVKGALTIEGRRLDADAPPLRAVIPDGYGDSGVQASALIFPTEGCWEVTGRVGDAALTFVTRVTKADQ